MKSEKNEQPVGTILPYTGEVIERHPDLFKASAMTTEQLSTAMSENERAKRQYAIDKAVERLSKSLGARYSEERCSLDSYKVTEIKQSSALQQLKTLDLSKGLIIYGTVGTGKDHMMAAMMYRACRAGKSVGWINGPELFGKFRDSFDSEVNEETILNRFVRPDILGISDPVPQIGDASSWRIEILYRVVELRYRELRPTWMTLNALSPEDADAKLSAQVFDRLRDDAMLIPCFWTSFREKKR